MCGSKTEPILKRIGKSEPSRKGVGTKKKAKDLVKYKQLTFNMMSILMIKINNEEGQAPT